MSSKNIYQNYTTILTSPKLKKNCMKRLVQQFTLILDEYDEKTNINQANISKYKIIKKRK